MALNSAEVVQSSRKLICDDGLMTAINMMQYLYKARYILAVCCCCVSVNP